MSGRRRIQEQDATAEPQGRQAAAVPAAAPPTEGMTPATLLHVQRSAGNAAASALLQRAPLTTLEKERNLSSPLFAGDEQLENAYDESPELAKPMKGGGVGKLQSALKDQGYDMPRSFKAGKPDGWFYTETEGTVSQFQSDEGLTQTGAVNRETMGRLDELAGAGAPASPRKPEIDATEKAMGKAVAEKMAAVNDPSTFGPDSGVWYDYNYFAEHQKDPAAYPWNEDWRSGKAPDQYWDKLGWMSWRLKAGVSAAEGIKAWLKGLTIAECLTTIIAIEIDTLRKAIGDDEFDNRYGSASKPVREKDRLQVLLGSKGTPIAGERLHWQDPEGKGGADKEGTFGNRPLQIGDWVYFYNHPKYLLKHPGGAWQGENAVYTGTDAAGRQLFTGLGAPGKTEEGMLLEMVKAYNAKRDADDFARLLEEHAADDPEVKKPNDKFRGRDLEYLRALYEKNKAKIPAIYHEDGGEFPDEVDSDMILNDDEYELNGRKRKGGFVSRSTKRLDEKAVGSMRR